MADVAIASDAVRTLVNQHRALIVIGEVLDDIVSLEQQRREADEAAVVARATRDAAIAEGDRARIALQASLDDVSAELAAAREELAATRALNDQAERAGAVERAELDRRRAIVESEELRIAEAKRQMTAMLA